MTVTIPLTLVVTEPLTAASLAAYLEQAFPGLAGPNPAAVAGVTMTQFKLADRYPTVADLDNLFRRTAAARASLEQQVIARPNVKKQAALTQIQQLNFALCTGDPTVYAMFDFRGDPWLKGLIDAAAKLVTA